MKKSNGENIQITFAKTGKFKIKNGSKYWFYMMAALLTILEEKLQTLHSQSPILVL